MKNTNRLFFALLAAAAFLFAAGCSDSDDTITASDLAGTTWKSTWETPLDGVLTAIITFDSSGNGCTVSYGLNGSSGTYVYTGTYTLSGTSLTITATATWLNLNATFYGTYSGDSIIITRGAYEGDFEDDEYPLGEEPLKKV